MITDRLDRFAMILLLTFVLSIGLLAELPNLETRIGCFMMGAITLLLWLKNLVNAKNLMGIGILFFINYILGLGKTAVGADIYNYYTPYQFHSSQICFFGQIPFLIVLGLIIILIVFWEALTEEE